MFWMKEEEKKDRFTELIKPLMPKLERYAMSVAYSREQAKDIAAETLLIAFERFDTLKDEKALLSFLFTIASRVRCELIRQDNRTDKLPENIAEIYQSNVASPETLTDICLLYEALGKLDSKMSEAIILFEIVGLKIKEISTVQNCSVAAVKLRLFRGRRKLWEMLI
jgi:RNA polymerase sigma-70 factor (ECF subfamily)